jgi:hypothetical protein
VAFLSEPVAVAAVWVAVPLPAGAVGTVAGSAAALNCFATDATGFAPAVSAEFTLPVKVSDFKAAMSAAQSAKAGATKPRERTAVAADAIRNDFIGGPPVVETKSTH